ncbi:MAG: ATP-dependent helicase [Betaproteobacteria bacterium]|nr:ATP-dependent helicase [Betaproteobacteria bacterium]
MPPIAPPLPASPGASANRSGAHLAALNPQQRFAVEYGIGDGDAGGPLLVVAGAGTGKTDTIAHRVAHLVVCGTDPRRILLLTFSRRAAIEMERRAGRILNRVLGARGEQRTPSLAWSGTFHGVGARLLRRYAGRIGLHESFTIHDRGDAEDLLAIVRHDLGFSATKNRFPTKATCLAVYSRVVNSEAPLEDVLKTTFPWCAQWEAELRRLFAAYVAAKQSQNVLDYDDLLLYWSQMMAEPALAAEVGARFDYVLVDEYQDTNRLQASILRAMKADGRGLTVVGDDAQSIYSFRAATVRNILDFPRQFTLPARVVTLERNYRSTEPILDASNAVIALATERFAKNLWTDRTSLEKPQLVTVRDEVDQARCVAERVLEYREAGIALKSQAVLFRTSSHSAQLELELTRRDIPFVKFGGLRFLEAAHVKDVLSVLRWAENTRSRMAGFRAARLVPGIGPATAAKLLDAMDRAPDPIAAMEAFGAPAAAAGEWQALVRLFGRLRARDAQWPADMDLVARWYEPHLQRIYEDAHVRQGDLAQLQQIAATYGSRERFLTEVTLDPPGATSAEAGVPGLDDDFLILSTIHSAKGQEWKTVHVLNVVDGCIPSDMGTGTSEDIEEERRLLYVAMTRAKDHLHLMVPQRFYVHQQAASGDRHVYASRSRFVPGTIAGLFDARAWPLAEIEAADARPPDEAPTARVDLSARVRALWR